ncbi:MAG: COG1470 family protein, partial [Methanobacteriota archaeon]
MNPSVRRFVVVGLVAALLAPYGIEFASFSADAQVESPVAFFNERAEDILSTTLLYFHQQPVLPGSELRRQFGDEATIHYMDTRFPNGEIIDDPTIAEEFTMPVKTLTPIPGGVQPNTQMVASFELMTDDGHDRKGGLTSDLTLTGNNSLKAVLFMEAPAAGTKFTLELCPVEASPLGYRGRGTANAEDVCGKGPPIVYRKETDPFNPVAAGVTPGQDIVRLDIPLDPVDQATRSAEFRKGDGMRIEITAEVVVQQAGSGTATWTLLYNNGTQVQTVAGLSPLASFLEVRSSNALRAAAWTVDVDDVPRDAFGTDIQNKIVNARFGLRSAWGLADVTRVPSAPPNPPAGFHKVVANAVLFHGNTTTGRTQGGPINVDPDANVTVGNVTNVELTPFLSSAPDGLVLFEYPEPVTDRTEERIWKYDALDPNPNGGARVSLALQRPYSGTFIERVQWQVQPGLREVFPRAAAGTSERTFVIGSPGLDISPVPGESCVGSTGPTDICRAGDVISHTVLSNLTSTFVVKVANRGGIRDVYTLTQSVSGANWRWVVGGPGVQQGDRVVLEPGQTKIVTIRAEPPVGSSPTFASFATLNLSATSTVNPTLQGFVAMSVQVVDEVQRRRAAGALVVNDTGVLLQPPSLTVSKGSAAVFTILAWNRGNDVDGLAVNLSSDCQSDGPGTWSTPVFNETGQTSSVAPGAIASVPLFITHDAQASSGSKLTCDVKVASVADRTKETFLSSLVVNVLALARFKVLVLPDHVRNFAVVETNVLRRIEMACWNAEGRTTFDPNQQVLQNAQSGSPGPPPVTRDCDEDISDDRIKRSLVRILVQNTGDETDDFTVAYKAQNSSESRALITTGTTLTPGLERVSFDADARRGNTSIWKKQRILQDQNLDAFESRWQPGTTSDFVAQQSTYRDTTANGTPEDVRGLLVAGVPPGAMFEAYLVISKDGPCVTPEAQAGGATNSCWNNAPPGEGVCGADDRDCSGGNASGGATETEFTAQVQVFSRLDGRRNPATITIQAQGRDEDLGESSTDPTHIKFNKVILEPIERCTQDEGPGGACPGRYEPDRPFVKFTNGTDRTGFKTIEKTIAPGGFRTYKARLTLASSFNDTVEVTVISVDFEKGWNVSVRNTTDPVRKTVNVTRTTQTEQSPLVIANSNRESFFDMELLLNVTAPSNAEVLDFDEIQLIAKSKITGAQDVLTIRARVGTDFGVQLNRLGPDTLFGHPGDTVVHGVNVSNFGSRGETFRVEVSPSTSFATYSLSAQDLFVPANQNGTITLSMVLATNAPAGHLEPATLTARRLSEDCPLTSTRRECLSEPITVRSQVVLPKNFRMSTATPVKTITPGGTASYEVNVTHLASNNTQFAIQLSVAQKPPGWDVFVPSEVTLPFQTTQRVTVIVQAGLSARQGSTFGITIRGQVRDDPTDFSQVSLLADISGVPRVQFEVDNATRLVDRGTSTIFDVRVRNIGSGTGTVPIEFAEFSKEHWFASFLDDS